MKSTIREILSQTIGSKVEAYGWVKSRRDSRTVSFIPISDGSCQNNLQVVVRKGAIGYEDVVPSLTTGCAVKVTGEIVESRGAGQATELLAESIEMLGGVEDPDTYPMQPKEHTKEHYRKYAHLRPKTDLFSAVNRIRSQLSWAIHDVMHQMNFHWIHTPIITGSDCEGAGEMFRVTAGKDEFFGKETFLTVSGQLNVEPFCLSMGRVYTFGPTFRAENSHTRRHLSEFWMIEPEIAFADLDDDIEVAESLLTRISYKVLESCEDSLAYLDKQHPGCLAKVKALAWDHQRFERMTYTEAIKLLQASGESFEFPVKWGCDLQAEHEQWLTSHVGGVTVVTDYPKDIKAFYMRLNDDEKTVAAMDILVPGIGEIVGGSQREERLDVLDARIKEMGMPIESYWWYRDLRRYGTVPHAGFGLGLERMIQLVTGVDNIRDVIPYPRAPGQAEF